ncbi:hypothetical protein [Flavisphingopyxis soli]|nr:hypothetical protein [Sphingorhabdus soli]
MTRHAPSAQDGITLPATAVRTAASNASSYYYYYRRRAVFD